MTNPVTNAVAMQLVYKAYADATITPGTEPVATVDPAVSGGRYLRRVGSTLSPVKATFRANEIQSHQQITDFRHGAKKVAGEISTELSPLSYQDFFASVVRGTWASGTSKTQADITSLAADSGTSKLTVGGSTWAAQGFKVGDVIRCSSFSSDNNGINFTITALSGVDATVNPAPTTAGADTSVTVTVVGRKVFAPESSPVKTKYAFEQYYSDLDLSHLYTECRITEAKVNVPASGVITASFGVMGRNMETYATGSSPFFTAPSAATSSTLLASFGGAIIVGGTALAVVTSAELNISNGASTIDAAFEELPVEIFTGSLEVTGSLTVLFEDNTLLTNFLDETEAEVIITLTTADSTTADFISFFMPRVKFTSANFANSGQQGVPVTLGFTALKKATTTGYDATTIVIQDSLSA